MKKNKDFSLVAVVVAIVFFVTAVIFGGIALVLNVQFNIHCKQYLKRAADSNTVELAHEELENALKYIEDKGLTEGNTSLIIKSPENDIGFWYRNLKASYEELENLDSNSSQLEKTNVLMKLRETLADEGNGTKITLPSNIHLYPYQRVIIFVPIGCLIAAIIIIFKL